MKELERKGINGKMSTDEDKRVWMFKKRSILFNGIIAIIAAFLCLSLHNYIIAHRGNVLFEQFLDATGLTIMLLGMCLRISARGYKSEKHLDKTVLITEGPYALTRNPMYLGSFLIGFGLVVLLLTWWAMIAYAFFFLIWYCPQIYYEQQWLKEKYGRDYSDYCKSTSCFFPRIKTLVSFKAKKYIPLKMKWVKKEWNTLLVWSVVALVSEGYEDFNFYGFTDFIREGFLLLLIIFYFGIFAVLFRTDEDDSL